MGFNSATSTITLTAKLTPSGREKIISNDNNLITKFSLGDSDANYNVTPTLVSGNVPTASGNLGSGGSSSTSTFMNVDIRSYINADALANIYKNVEPSSNSLSVSVQHLGDTTLSGASLTHLNSNRSLVNDKFVNLFHSFSLPLDSNDVNNYTGVTIGNGGFSDTALSGIAGDEIIIIEIPNATYGEVIDGKTVKVELTTTGATSAYTLYSTYQNTGIADTALDANFNETSSETSQFTGNYAFLFSDEIKEPNGDSGKTWSTGYGTPKPFNVYNKEKYNLTTDVNAGEVADEVVGIVYLDRGFIVITHPDIVSTFNVNYTGHTDETRISFNSVSTEISQQITCIAGANEFVTSKNVTYGSGDTVRISEIGLYDDTNDLIAIAKTDRQILKPATQFISLGIKVIV